MFVFLLEYIHFLEYILCQSRVVIHAYWNNLDVVKLKLCFCILWHGCLAAEPVVLTLFEELFGEKVSKASFKAYGDQILAQRKAGKLTAAAGAATLGTAGGTKVAAHSFYGKEE